MTKCAKKQDIKQEPKGYCYVDRYITASEVRNDFSGTMSRAAYGARRGLVPAAVAREKKSRIVPIEETSYF